MVSDWECGKTRHLVGVAKRKTNAIQDTLRHATTMGTPRFLVRAPLGRRAAPRRSAVSEAAASPSLGSLYRRKLRRSKKERKKDHQSEGICVAGEMAVITNSSPSSHP